MSLRTSVAAILLLCGCGSAAFGQIVRARDGFVVITPVSGSLNSLVVTETLNNQAASGLLRTAASPSPLVMIAALPVSIGSVPEDSSAIAIANPSPLLATVNLFLTDEQGGVILSLTFNIPPYGHFSRFLNELFLNPAAPTIRRTALLLISSNVPVGSIGLNFTRSSIYSTAVTPLSNILTIPIQPLPLFTPIQPAPLSTGTFTTVTGVVIPFPTTGSLTGTNIGIATGTNAGIVTGTTPGVITGTPPNFGIGVAPAATSLSSTVVSIGGPGSMVLPQFANGGGWFSEITIGNVSNLLQTLRIDFFEDGVIVASLPAVVIPPHGVSGFSSLSCSTGLAVCGFNGTVDALRR